MALTFRAAAGANGGTTNTNTLTTTLPAGAAAGDLLIMCVSWGNNTLFNAVTGWTLVAQAQNPTGGVSAGAVYSRIMQAGDAAPTITNASTGKRSYVSSAWTPGAGETPSIYAQAATLISASGTTATPNPVTSTDANTVSYVFNATREQGNLATAITQTPASTWLEPTNGDQSTATGTTAALRQVGAHVGYKSAVGTGSIAPGAFTFNVAVIDIAFHMLLRSVVSIRVPVKRSYPHYRR